MQVGDLVELSAYGRKLKSNEFARGKVGLITRAGKTKYGPCQHINVAWCGEIKTTYQVRRDLKHAK